MKNHDWLKTWETGVIPFHQESVNPYLLTHFSRLNLGKNDHILVPLCGKSLDMVWLAKQGLRVTGIELSPVACHDFFSNLQITPEIIKQKTYTLYQHANITLFCADFFALNQNDLPPIQAVYDCKALIALPHDIRIAYAKHLMSFFNHKTAMLLLVMDTTCQVKSPPYPVSSAEVSNLFGENLNMQQVQHQPIATNISDNLLQKGYAEYTENVFILTT